MRSMPVVWYLTASVGLILVAFLFTFEGGMVLVLLGSTMLLLAPLRHRRGLYWPVLLAVALFLVGFVLTVPLDCSGPIGPTPGAGIPETCRSIIGITQTRSGTDISLGPSIVIGALVGMGGFLMLRRGLRPRKTQAAR